ncbi:hypothetical protein AAY473_021760 [Plecturocebus cupreus]
MKDGLEKHGGNSGPEEMEYVKQKKQIREITKALHYLIKQICDWVWWLTPVIPALWEAKVGRSQGQENKISLADTVKPCLYLKIQEISWVWWYIPVVLAIREAEAGECLNLGGRRCGAVAHTCNPSTLGNQGERITRGQAFETSLVNMTKPRLY